MFRCSLWAALLAGAAAGCGGGPEAGPKLTGRVLLAGRPCRPASVYDFDIVLMSPGDGPVRKSYLAVVEPDGTFALNGAVGKGVPVGRYKVVVAGSVIDANGKPTRKYHGAFTDKATPLEVELTDDSRELTIDLELRKAEVR